MLDFFTIAKIADYVEKELVTHDIKKSNILTIVVDKEQLKKIDEDIYFRQNPEGTDFKPSKDEITINFTHVTIKIKTEQ